MHPKTTKIIVKVPKWSQNLLKYQNCPSLCMLVSGCPFGSISLDMREFTVYINRVATWSYYKMSKK